MIKANRLLSDFLLDLEEKDDLEDHQTKSVIIKCEANLSHYCSGKYIATHESPDMCLLCKRV